MPWKSPRTHASVRNPSYTHCVTRLAWMESVMVSYHIPPETATYLLPPPHSAWLLVFWTARGVLPAMQLLLHWDSMSRIYPENKKKNYGGFWKSFWYQQTGKEGWVERRVSGGDTVRGDPIAWPALSSPEQRNTKNHGQTHPGLHEAVCFPKATGCICLKMKSRPREMAQWVKCLLCQPGNLPTPTPEAGMAAGVCWRQSQADLLRWASKCM